MDSGLIVQTECPKGGIIAIRQSILPRKDPLSVQVDDNVVAVTYFEDFLRRLRRGDRGPGEYDFSAFDPSFSHLLARRHRKHGRTGSVPVYQNESGVLR